MLRLIVTLAAASLAACGTRSDRGADPAQQGLALGDYDAPLTGDAALPSGDDALPPAGDGASPSPGDTAPYDGPALHLETTPGSLRWPAPTLGEHTAHVLGDVLGMSEEEIARLVRDKIAW